MSKPLLLLCVAFAPGLTGCNGAAPAANVTPDTPVAATAAGTAPRPVQTAAAHDWAGEYERQPSQDDMGLVVELAGRDGYKVTVSWGGATVTGIYNSDSWEGSATAQGNVLTIRRPDGSDPANCSLRYTPGARLPYRLSGCGTGDGAYRRTGSTNGASVPAARDAARAMTTSRSALVGAWANPQYGCEGDGGLFLNANGWSRNSNGGTWTLSDGTLKIVTKEIFDDDGNPQKVVPPTVETYAIVSLSPDRMALRERKGGVEHYIRCR